MRSVRFSGCLKALEPRRAGVLQRRQSTKDRRGDKVLEVHPKTRRLEIEPAARRARLHARLETPCGLRLENPLVFGQGEVKRRGFEAVTVIAGHLAVGGA